MRNIPCVQVPVNGIIPVSIAKEYEDEMLDGIEQQLAEEQPAVVSKNRTLEDYDYLRVTAEKDIPKPSPFAKIGASAIASPGNITGISAIQKTGKTAAKNVMVTGAISETGSYDGFPDLWVQPNVEKKAVISIDTEQAEDDQQYNLRTVLKRLDLSLTPDYYQEYNFRKLDFGELKKVLIDIVTLCAIRFNGIHSIFIDGGAEFVRSVNDEVESNDALKFFVQLAINYNCPVFVIVHLNPYGTQKERGHFGSELLRRCYAMLTIEKKDGVSCLTCKVARKASEADTPAIFYHYDKEKGYHTAVCDNPEKDSKKDKERIKLSLLAEKIIKPLDSFTAKECVERIMLEGSVSQRTAFDYLKRMCLHKILEHGQDDKYRMLLQTASYCKSLQNCI